MSHSRIFDEYAKLMSAKGLLKTADKKDPDYNIVPDKAGPDTKVDETGWELTEIAHPEQIQVAESRLNDGIVENGVERQKVMIDVALRNPRGVIASLMQTLVKAANVLDADMTEESLKLAKEVDDFLVSLAQQSQVVLSPEAARKADEHRLPRLKAAVQEALSNFKTLDWNTFGFGGSGWWAGDQEKETTGTAQSEVNDAMKKLQAFIELPDDDAVRTGNTLAQYINQNYKMIRSAIQKSKDWGNDQTESIAAWDALRAESDEWLLKGRPAEEKKPVEMTAPGVASKGKGAPRQHNYSVSSAEVKQLQHLLKVPEDGKFGPRTFGALAEAAKTNSPLDQLMQNKPKGFAGWSNSDVGEALLRMQDAEKSSQQAAVPAKPAKKEELLNPYPEGYETGWNAAKSQK